MVGASTFRRFLWLVAAFGSGAALSLAAFLIVRGWELSHRDREFAIAAENRAQLVEQQLLGISDLLHAIANFYAASETVERGEFRTFVADSLPRFPSLRALEWAPLVPDDERGAFVAAARRQ